MLMPETPMNEDDFFALPKNEVGTAREISLLVSESQAL